MRDSTGATPFDERWDGAGGFHTDALRRVLAWVRRDFPNANIAAAGHRVIHGGVGFEGPVIITDEVLHALEALVPLAPLHQPHDLANITAARAA